ncbi:MAG: flagellar hook-length control protein FliK [Bacillaceae bacterium]|nr:flagellar hook-length control protein FliK [Bacillaceae bacterium]
MNETVTLQTSAMIMATNAQKGSMFSGKKGESAGFASLLQTLTGDTLPQEGSVTKLEQLMMLLNQVDVSSVLNPSQQGTETQNQAATGLESELAQLLKLLNGSLQPESDEFTEALQLLSDWMGLKQPIDPSQWEQLTAIPAQLNLPKLEQVLDTMVKQPPEHSRKQATNSPVFTGGQEARMLNQQVTAEELPHEQIQRLLEVLSSQKNVEDVHASRVQDAVFTKASTLAGREWANLSSREQVVLKIMTLLSRLDRGDRQLPGKLVPKLEQVLSMLGSQPAGQTLVSDHIRNTLYAEARVDTFTRNGLNEHENLSVRPFTHAVMTDQHGSVRTEDATARVFAHQLQAQAGLVDQRQSALVQPQPGQTQPQIMQEGQPSPLIQASRFSEDMPALMVQQLKMMKGHDASRATIRLYPESLGQLNVEIVTRNGQITAQFIAETGMGKDLIESQLHVLRHALVQHGLQVDKLEVSQGQPTSGSSHQAADKGDGFSQQQPKQHQQQHEQHSGFSPDAYSLYDDSELDFEEALIRHEADTVRQSIDYTV